MAVETRELKLRLNKTTIANLGASVRTIPDSNSLNSNQCLSDCCTGEFCTLGCVPTTDTCGSCIAANC